MPPIAKSNPTRADDNGNVFSLLAEEARDRPSLGLWTTAIGGAANAALLWHQFSGLHWLAAGFTAVAAYGAWGIADRAQARVRDDTPHATARRRILSAVRAVSIPVGVIAALGAAASFMAAALGGWQH